MNFPQQLARFRRRQRAGRLAAWLLATAGGAIAVLLVLMALDLQLAWESPSRILVVKIAAALIAIAAITAFIVVIRLSRQRAATLADDALGSPRRPVAAALAVDPGTADTPLGKFLAKRSLDEAASALARLPAKQALPWPWLRRAGGALCLVLIGAAVFRSASPLPFATALDRMVHPDADIPPWSRLRFTLDPAQPSVLYGGDLLVTCTLDGDHIDKPVECLLRQPGSNEVLRLPAARESANRFSRKLDAVTRPVEVAFACGKARSRWLPVEILLQPNVLAGALEITPPVYTGLPTNRGPLDSNEISVPEGSAVVLELTSNRPLGAATLTFTPARTGTTDPAPVETAGETSGHTARFAFTAGRSGKLSIVIRDVRGTPSAKPSELALKMLPDQPPVIDLTSPPPLLLATPKTKIPVEASATDDLGLSRIQLVRTLSGFRDRSLAVAKGLVKTREYGVHDGLDLAKLGLQPGQTIELFLEASDYNPSLLGQGTSGISRIQIISEDDYAARLRAKTTLKQFSARFQAVARAREEARKALEELEKAAGNPEAAEKARQDALEANRKAAELMEKLGGDFPVFEAEKRLQALAREAAGPFKQNTDDLAKLDPKASAPAQREAVRQMLERLDKPQPKMEEAQKDAATIAEAGRLLEMAAKFHQIYETQQSLVKRIGTIAKEIAQGDDQNKRLLGSLADTQQKNREALEEFVRELEKRSATIQDPQLQEFKESALAFAQHLRLADPGSVMDAASKHARDGASNDAFTNAEMARSQLESLMQGEDGFPKACQGKAPKFSIPRPDVNQTMQQMLEGLMSQNPGTTPNQKTGGGGMGAGGTGPTGSAEPGYALSDLPVLGPDRLQFDPASLGGSANGDARSTRPVKGLPTTTETGTIKPTESRTGDSGGPTPEAVPAIYREAVKRYFSGE
ncbi:hypothetical protein KBB96_00300 [Luteolibacter ambystomatis]|uniref:DUF4175 family protein n=1 Tax=Luteolibacter ambystomatis TaxID=2824561 RepID=A0A975G8M4_9BACT|nr:DUF4175 family protein [Luteolibacter ambystomatis]QUE51357.1 hypothetical protein KBB96_00300 [Luteolibacter ambystomatis]